MNVMEVFKKADEAGKEAARNAKVVPMVVGTPTSLFSNDIDKSKPTYYVEGGVCGFAEVIFPDGRKKYVKELKKAGLVQQGVYKGYYMWIRDYGQSMQLKEAYAYAFADVFNEAGFKCYASSRMD